MHVGNVANMHKKSIDMLERTPRTAGRRDMPDAQDAMPTAPDVSPIRDRVRCSGW